MKNIVDLVPRGYCVSPNNIAACPGVMIYAAGPGVPEPSDIFAEINLRPSGQVAVGRIRVVPGRCLFEAEALFSDGEDFLEYYRTHGQPSIGGMAAYPQNWD